MCLRVCPDVCLCAREVRASRRVEGGSVSGVYVLFVNRHTGKKKKRGTFCAYISQSTHGNTKRIPVGDGYAVHYFCFRFFVDATWWWNDGG